MRVALHILDQRQQVILTEAFGLEHSASTALSNASLRSALRCHLPPSARHRGCPMSLGGRR